MKLWFVGAALTTVGFSTLIHATPGQSIPMLLPGSSDLGGTHFEARCRNVQRFAHDVGDAAERPLGTQRVVERPTVHRGKPALLLVSSGKGAQAFVDSALVFRDGLAPISETVRSGRRVMTFTYNGPRVRFSSTQGDSMPVVKDHRYSTPVFSFQELDAVIRSLPLRSGYSALLPLYSEGDDSVEVDTVRVEGKATNGVWQIRFADPAIVATIGVDEKSRAEVAYSHAFRQSGPSWKIGTVWRQVYAAC